MKLTLGAVVKGGTSLKYKTGSWREQKPVIEQELCKKCRICKDVCPDDAIIINGDRYDINYDYCKGCGICAHECTAVAINMVPEAR